MSDDNRTLQPTAQRRQRARLEGNVAVSGQVTAAVVWLVAAAAVFFAGQHRLASIKGLFDELWAVPYESGVAGLTDALLLAARILVPVLAIIVAAALIGRLSQVGYVWVPRRVLPQASRVNPSRHLGQLLSPGKLHHALLAAGLGLGGIAMVSWGIWSQRSELLGLIIAADLETELLQYVAIWGLRLGCGLVAFAVVDYAFQRHRFELSLRMSPDELRAEIKAIQGNPQVASGRSELRRGIPNTRSSQRDG